MAQIQIKQLKIRQATKDEDYLGADIWLNDLALGHRERRIKVGKYREISIRRRNYTRSEFEKIRDGECLAQLHLFEFTDAYVLCKTSDIRQCIIDDFGHFVPNPTEPNEGYYIALADIPHLLIMKTGELYG